MRFQPLKVGELAKRTGLTIRTLHHYDEIGLLRPSADLARLQQVISLRQLGFSLEEVGACLDRADFSPVDVIRMHLARLREQIEMQKGLCERLESLAHYFSNGRAEEVSAEEFLQSIEVMTMIANYYTP
jgi:DNA-binding transcriptional MerR regulator